MLDVESLNHYNNIMDTEYSFNGQREGEKVVLMVKNHPFVLFSPGLKCVVCIALGLGAILYLDSKYAGLLLVLLILIGLALAANSFYNFFQSVFLVTNERLIYVNQRGFWHRKIIETEIGKVQDVASETQGLFKIILHFGNLIIRTAGASKGEEIVVKNIPNPYEVQKRIGNK